MEEKKFDVKKEEVAVKKEVKLQKSCKVDDLYYFKSDDQLLYVGSCLAAANLGFDILNKNDFVAKSWISDIERAETYAEKSNVILRGVFALCDNDVRLDEAFIQERKHFIQFVKINSLFNDSIQKYIDIAEAV